MAKKATTRDKPIDLTEGERLMLRYMLADKTKWIPAAARAFSLHERDDAVASLAIIDTFAGKLAAISG